MVVANLDTEERETVPMNVMHDTHTCAVAFGIVNREHSDRKSLIFVIHVLAERASGNEIVGAL